MAVYIKKSKKQSIVNFSNASYPKTLGFYTSSKTSVT